MRRAISGRRCPKDSLQDRLPIDTRHLSTIQNRDSDASFCSLCHPSHQHLPRFPLLLHCPQAPSPLCQRHHCTIRFLFTHLDSPSFKLEEDLPLLLKHLNCPFKLNKSALKAPGTLHSWPSLLAVIHWLIELAFYNDHIASSSITTTNSLFRDNRVLTHIINCYSLYIHGDDDGVEEDEEEEKCWHLDATLVHKLKELENLSIE
uniref:Kinetochore protein NDC80 n=1 Tax=Nelumbo nucifera TaxID=4432 RepID=A0A822XFA7_NELNU|nr:TPA_asm: hypothetical protein HUJ06_019816 [Nelumbo nucifera]